MNLLFLINIYILLYLSLVMTLYEILLGVEKDLVVTVSLELEQGCSISCHFEQFSMITGPRRVYTSCL